MIKQLAASVVICSLISAGLTYHLTESHWENKWLARDNADKQSQIAYQQDIKKKSDQFQQDRDKLQDDNEKIKQDYEDKLAANADSSRRLLTTIAALRKDRADKLSTTTGTIEGKDDTYLLQSDLLGKSIERNGQLAGYADELRNSLISCNRQYNSVTNKKAP